MIERYSRKEMADIWSTSNKLNCWLEVEILTCEAFAVDGLIPMEEIVAMRKNAVVNVERMLEIEAETRHDVVAFTRMLSESLGAEKKWVHYGLTSTDVVDTAQAIQFKQANDIIWNDLCMLEETLKTLAQKHKRTYQIGRTHGVHAEVTTFGLKLALYYEELKRNKVRFELARSEVETGKISGSVGTCTYAHPKIQDYVCEKLAINSAAISTQVLQRDRHAFYLNTLAIIATSIEKIATELRHLQRTEVREVFENFSKNQKGSSSMPHKKNPISSENICGLARTIRGYAMTSYDNVALWHERDISHSSAERVILPDATILVDYILNRMNNVLNKMYVDEERMMHNIMITNNVIYSQDILTAALSKENVSREEIYDIVQTLALKSWNESLDFRILVENSKLNEILSVGEIEECFKIENKLRNLDAIYERVFI